MAQVEEYFECQNFYIDKHLKEAVELNEHVLESFFWVSLVKLNQVRVFFIEKALTRRIEDFTYLSIGVNPEDFLEFYDSNAGSKGLESILIN